MTHWEVPQHPQPLGSPLKEAGSSPLTVSEDTGAWLRYRTVETRSHKNRSPVHLLPPARQNGHTGRLTHAACGLGPGRGTGQTRRAGRPSRGQRHLGPDEHSHEDHWSLQAVMGHLPLGPSFPSQWDSPVKTVSRFFYFCHFKNECLLNLTFLHRNKVVFP